jgi:hypothetical protein
MRWTTLAICLLGFVAPAAARVSGGGPAAVDCFAEFDGPGITAVKGTRVECTDGDPECDTDDTCDGTCEFLVRVCVSQCATAKTIDRIVNVKGAPLQLPALPASAPACGGYASVTTRKPKGKKAKPGKARISLTAFAAGEAKGDRDKVTLVCKPRKDACPPLDEVRRTGIADPPPLLVDPPVPAGGQPAIVILAAPPDAATSLAVSGDGCGAIAPVPSATGPLSQRAAVGAFGRCDLVATIARPGEAPQTVGASFVVEPTELQLPELTLANGVFLPGALPPQTGSPSDPLITGVTGAGTLINGGTVQLRLALADPAQAARLRSAQVQVVGAGGYTGYFDAPIQLDAGTPVVELQLSEDFQPAIPLSQVAAAPGQLDAIMQLVDLEGNVGNRLTHTFGTQAVQAGPLQVSLSWDSETDLDLHLIEPGGDEIWYGNRTSPAGGTLDLDSNPGCSIDGTNNENISYGVPLAPARGEYVVNVDFYSDCAQEGSPGKPANFTVTVRVCGEVKTFTGSFAAGTSDSGGAGSGQEVARFSANCGLRVRGRAYYEDRGYSAGRLSSDVVPLPIRFARVQVFRDSDHAVIGAGFTKQDGKFDIRFSNDGPKGYFVVIFAYQDNNLIGQQVFNDANELYNFSSYIVDETAEPDKTFEDPLIAKANESGPAFNIFDNGVEAILFLRRVFGHPPDAVLNWLWTSGRKGTCRGDVSCYRKSSNTISVYSQRDNPDEWDDPVLLHEFGHFFLKTYIRSDSPGGRHSGEQVDPRLAFDEGTATFFATRVRKQTFYFDLAETVLDSLLEDLEHPELTPSPLGTSDGTQNGNVSEDIVAAILVDLADDSPAEAKDTVARGDATFSALAALALPTLPDRGVAGADLVNALDGWFCKALGDRGDANSGVEGIVKGIHQFPYDFAPVADCR